MYSNCETDRYGFVYNNNDNDARVDGLFNRKKKLLKNSGTQRFFKSLFNLYLLTPTSLPMTYFQFFFFFEEEVNPFKSEIYFIRIFIFALISEFSKSYIFFPFGSEKGIEIDSPPIHTIAIISIKKSSNKLLGKNYHVINSLLWMFQHSVKTRFQIFELINNIQILIIARINRFLI